MRGIEEWGIDSDGDLGGDDSTQPLLRFASQNRRPLLLVAVLIFFAVSLLVEKYNFVYVFRRRFESGGRMWRQAFVQVMTALYIFQVRCCISNHMTPVSHRGYR